jgi:hypothetical protein
VVLARASIPARQALGLVGFVAEANGAPVAMTVAAASLLVTALSRPAPRVRGDGRAELPREARAAA